MTIDAEVLNPGAGLMSAELSPGKVTDEFCFKASDRRVDELVCTDSEAVALEALRAATGER
jgi:hypothetical protein